MNNAARMNYQDIPLGAVYSFEKQISRQDIQSFASLTGDFNPLHTDPEFGKKSKFNNNIVHGMLAGSLFSTLVGMHCPGEKCLYLQQTLNFREPLFPDDKVTVRGTVVDKNDAIRIITLKTEILKNGRPVITGEAKVKVLEDA